MDGSWPQGGGLVEGPGGSGRHGSGVDGLWTELTRSVSGEDDGTAEASVLAALQWIQESEVNAGSEHRLDEVEKILKNIISMSRKYSQSEAALPFSQSASLDSAPPLFQSPVTAADIRRSNGFCLANTETVLYDEHLPNQREKPRRRSQTSRSHQVLTRLKQEELHYDAEAADLNLGDSRLQEPDPAAPKPQNYAPRSSLLQPETCETDILE